MRVGLVSPYDYSHPGGVNQHIRHLSEQLRDLGHDVRVLAPSSYKRVADPDFRRVGGVIPVPVNNSVARISLNPLRFRRISELLEDERFDVLHLHEPLAPMLPLAVLRRSTTVNVGTFHAYAEASLPYAYSREFLAPYLHRLHAQIAVSEVARDFVRRFFPWADPVVVPNGVDITRFRGDLPPVRHLRDRRVNFLFVGRLEERKGVRDLVRGFGLVRQRIGNCRLIVVGEGPDRRDLEAILRAEHIEDVVLAGRVPDEVLPRYHASSDVFCAPATSGESFGIVLAEAMAAGLPVVCTSIPGYRAVVVPGVTGLVVLPGRPDQLGEAMIRLAEDAALRRRMGEEGRRLTREQYAWPVVTARLVEIYERAHHQLRKEVEASVHR
jgi:phosphatidyl-myo-inositol alpha-mannosyltransferase